MGRRAEGPKLDKRGEVYWAYFTTPAAAPDTRGTEHRFSLGTTDPVEAQKRLAFEYAEALAGRGRARARVAPSARGDFRRPPMDEALAAWIDETAAPSMGETLTIYAKHYLAHYAGDWSRIADPDEGARYVEARLRAALRRTVMRERMHLLRFLGWSVRQRYLAAVPPIAPIDRGKRGTMTGPQRERRVEITIEQAWSVIARMRTHSKRIDGRRWPIRDRYALAWMLALRPATMSRLEVPRNWAPGRSYLHLDAGDEPKATAGRDIDLSPEAVAILERCAPAQGGPIFGWHAFEPEIKRVAVEVLGPALGRLFAAYDFRHGRLQGMVDLGAPLAGAGYVAGHARLTTTDIYTRANRRAGRAAAELARAADARAVASHAVIGPGGGEPPAPPSPPLLPPAGEANAKQVASSPAAPTDRRGAVQLYALGGVARSLAEWAEVSGVSKSTLYHRVAVRGMSLADALGREARRGVPLASIRTVSAHAGGEADGAGSQPIEKTARPARFERATPGSVGQAESQKHREKRGGTLPAVVEKRRVVIPFPYAVRISEAERRGEVAPWVHEATANLYELMTRAHT